MSTILEALEKANKRKAAGAQGNAAPNSLNVANVTDGDWRERQLREEMERHRQRNRLLGGIVFVVGLLLLITIYMLWHGANARAAAAAQANPPVAASTADVAPVPAAAPVTPATPSINQGTEGSAASPAPAPVSAAPSPSPTATPTQTPTPEASPTPAPSPTPEPTPSPVPARTFADGEVIYDVDLGIDIEGVLKDGSQSVVLVDGEAISLGRKHKMIRPLSVLDKMVECEVDQPGGKVVVLYIRY